MTDQTQKDIETVRNFIETPNPVWPSAKVAQAAFNRLHPPPVKLEVGKWYLYGGDDVPVCYAGPAFEKDYYVFSLVGMGGTITSIVYRHIENFRECEPPEGV